MTQSAQTIIPPYQPWGQKEGKVKKLMKFINTFLKNWKLWQIMKEIPVTKKIKLDSFPKKLKIKEKHKIKPYKNANELNKFFTGIGPNLASNIANITKSFKSYLVPF